MDSVLTIESNKGKSPNKPLIGRNLVVSDAINNIQKLNSEKIAKEKSKDNNIKEVLTNSNTENKEDIKEKDKTIDNIKPMSFVEDSELAIDKKIEKRISFKKNEKLQSFSRSNNSDMMKNLKYASEEIEVKLKMSKKQKLLQYGESTIGSFMTYEDKMLIHYS